MNPYFDDNPMSGEDEKGEPIFFDWLRVDDDAPVRVELKKDFAKSNLGLAWTDEEAIRQAFDRIKREHIGEALRAPPRPGRDYRVYTIK